MSVTESNERDGRTAFPPRTRVILRCSFINLARRNQPPVWFHEVGPGIYRSPHELRNEYKISFQFDSDSCVWTSWLTIKSLTQHQTGVYVCNHNTISVNKTLTLPGMLVY